MIFKLISKVSGHNLILPFYHCVCDEFMPHANLLYHCLSVKDFDKALNSILRYFNPISLEDVFQHTQGINRITRPSFHLTFDDGFSTNYTIVAPLLLKKGIPATFFINTGFIDNVDLMHRCKINLLLNSLKSDVYINKLIKFLNCNINQLNSCILSMNYSDIERINQACRLIEIDLQEYLIVKKPYMTSQQIMELSKKGFSIGSHSVDHPEFRFLSLNKQIEEIKNSIDYINIRYPQKYSVFSFPFTDYGISNDLFNIIFDPMKPIVDLTFGAAGIKDDHVKYNLQRIPMDKNSLDVNKLIAWQFFKYLVYRVIGKQYSKR